MKTLCPGSSLYSSLDARRAKAGQKCAATISIVRSCKIYLDLSLHRFFSPLRLILHFYKQLKLLFSGDALKHQLFLERIGGVIEPNW